MMNNREEILLGRKRINLQLPSRNETIRFIGYCAGWFIIRIPLVTCDVITYIAKTIGSIAQVFKRSYHSTIVKTFDFLPYAFADDGIGVIETTAVSSSDIQPVVDIIKYLYGKHCIIVGGTGTGKSTLAQSIAYQNGGNIRVYDADCTPQEWVGLEVVGRGGDLDAIDKAMANDLIELQDLMERRGINGDAAIAGTDKVYIAEEFPLLVEDCDNAPNWLKKHAKRGRRVKRFVIGIAQNDTVSNWGLEGDSGTLNSFVVIRLGKFATEHAKRLKNASLIEYVNNQERKALIDDMPLVLPDPSQINVIQRLSTPTNTLSQVPVTQNEVPDNEPDQVYQIYDDPKLSQRLNKLIAMGKKRKGEWIEARDIQSYKGVFDGIKADEVRYLFVRLEADGHGYTDSGNKAKWRLDKPE